MRAAFARSRSALIACGVVGAVRRVGIGRVLGPALGVRAAVPGVLTVIFEVLLLYRPPVAGPALDARWRGVDGF